MNNIDVVVIGAGATGLMAANILAKAGKKVTVLEARNRCGGRIHTLSTGRHLKNAETGAEFIHGNLPVTLNLLKEAGIAYHKSGGKMWRYKNGHFDNEGIFTGGWDQLMEKLWQLEQDINIEDFLGNEFAAEKYSYLKDSVRKFVSGYDTADTTKASSFALRREWQSEDDGTSYRVDGGYGAIIDYLEQSVKNAGGDIHLNSIVKQINWQPANVKVRTKTGAVYEAAQMLIALPLGVLQAGKNATGAVTFNPPLKKQIDAINKMGYGAVIKILLEFDEPFWEDKFTEALAGKSLGNMGFILSDEIIPTWWTQAPGHSRILTGWLGGPAAAEKKDVPDEDILQQSLQSLSNIFKRSTDELRGRLLAFDIINWTNDPFTRGSYVYDTIESPAARKILDSPVENTIFFAGEYLYDGPVMGTVEAALTSGVEAARKIL
jgi:monoamine oxidase